MEKEIDSDSAEISGSFSQREADRSRERIEQSRSIFRLQHLEHATKLAASFGDDAVSSGVKATVIGAVAVVAAFMAITFYATGGFGTSILSLALNIVIILGVMAGVSARPMTSSRSRRYRADDRYGG